MENFVCVRKLVINGRNLMDEKRFYWTKVKSLRYSRRNLKNYI